MSASEKSSVSIQIRPCIDVIHFETLTPGGKRIAGGGAVRSAGLSGAPMRLMVEKGCYVPSREIQ